MEPGRLCSEACTPRHGCGTFEVEVKYGFTGDMGEPDHDGVRAGVLRVGGREVRWMPVNDTLPCDHCRLQVCTGNFYQNAFCECLTCKDCAFNAREECPKPSKAVGGSDVCSTCEAHCAVHEENAVELEQLQEEAAGLRDKEIEVEGLRNMVAAANAHFELRRDRKFRIGRITTDADYHFEDAFIDTVAGRNG